MFLRLLFGMKTDVQKQISLERLRAAYVVFQRKEEKYLQKVETGFRPAILTRNRSRLQRFQQKFNFEENRQWIREMLTWEDKSKSTPFLICFILFSWNFEIWMIPLLIIGLLIREGINKTLSGNWVQNLDDVNLQHESEDDKKGNFERIFGTLFHIQQMLGTISSFLESIENVMNFSVPFLSIICILTMFLVMMVVSIIPLRILFIIWGVNKITKKLFRPWSTSNNEIASFLSRVPDRVEMHMYQ